MNWPLIKKQETICRKPFNCDDCGEQWPSGAYVKKFVFKKDDNYLTKKVCEDCEKYYRRKDMQHRG